MSKQKLELTWIGKEKRPKLEPRILVEDPDKSYHAKHRVSDNDIFDNRLIFGDNLLALKALEQEFTGKVKCVFIDPPYNTGSAFTHYDDGLEHSIWLGLMRDRLEIIRRLLSEDGSLWITIDDNEAHYLKVLCDEIFGRRNFIASSIWQHSVQGKGYSGKFSVHHNYVLAYKKSDSFLLKDLPRTEEHNVNYSNPDNDPRGLWRAGDVRNSLVRPNLMYDIETPGGKLIKHPPKGWRFSKDTFERELAEGKIKFSADESRIIRKIYLADQEGRVPETLWLSTDVGTTREASGEVRGFVDVEYFDTPKPERLIQRVLALSTQPGDWVIDSFAGSGTTGAVAHKMGRRWIMVELGEHCHTHIIPRLKKVIDGEDKGGITEAVNWQGGGGFRYYKLAPSLIINDRWGNPVVNPDYNAAHLAEALCKIEGFTYAPSEVQWWQHGNSSERDFIYVTTQNLSSEQLQTLSDEVGTDQSLLVCCAAFHSVTAAKASERWPNLTLKKIPKMVLARCEWGHDDYSLNVANLPMAQIEKSELTADASTNKPSKIKKAAPGQGGLLGEDE
ncbi:site-specific DNA-methyltransferase [Nitrosomonas mobilis]|uniref:site-specific DNA-methyltransferase (adenine-specific) n=1 Tax=Nitrosomonas mobilis TaxID=51642 RepID=A0A1G5SGB2_9PROT|nr:site-specific DNA-methyltransferase [Nitrosomonas mobilis]SCZ86236.1 Adenine specific DNA methylase Mod [Nitrosomonas mobilis]